MTPEREKDVDAAIDAIVAIGVLDGANKRDRLSRAVARLLIAARAEWTAEHADASATLRTEVARLTAERDEARSAVELSLTWGDDIACAYIGTSEACDSLNEDARRIERLLGYEYEAPVDGERLYTIEDHIKEHVLPARALTEAELAVLDALRDVEAAEDSLSKDYASRGYGGATATEVYRLASVRFGKAKDALRAARAAGKDGAR